MKVNKKKYFRDLFNKTSKVYLVNGISSSSSAFHDHV